MNLICPVSSQLVSSVRLVSAPANFCKFGFESVNRRVASSSLARGAILHPMSSKRLVVLNIGLILGCIGALFIVPRSTSLKLYLWICAGILVLPNAAIATAKIRRIGGSDQPGAQSRSLPWQFWVVVVLLIVLMFLLNHGYWNW